MPTTEQQVAIEIEVVEAFLSALERFDTDEALALCDPDVEYQNVPFPPARGREAVARQLEGFAKACRAFEVHNHNVAANGPVVLTERTDVITIGPVRSAFWVCGTFEVHDGLITVWRDRFDFVNLSASVVTGAVRALLQRGSS